MQGLLKSRQLGQGKQGVNSSYNHLHLFIKDPLIPVKLQLFEGISSGHNSFLITFQSDKLMILFLVETEELLTLLWEKFIRKDTFDAAQTTYTLLKVDVTGMSKYKSVSDVELGFAFENDIKYCYHSEK